MFCGAQAADRLSKSLGGFVASVEAAAARKIEVLPKGCPGLCRDECLAVSIIAASQRGVCPALRACIFALIENGEIEPCVRSAAEFSHALSETGYTLPADVVCNALALMPDGAGRTHAECLTHCLRRCRQAALLKPRRRDVQLPGCVP